MPQVLVDPRLVKVRAGARGSGWAIGRFGVLTAWHVVKPFLDGQCKQCFVVPGDGTWGAVECSVQWHDDTLDLALLLVTEQDRARWTAAVGEGPGPSLAEIGTRAVDGDAVGYPDATVENATAEPDRAEGRLLPPGAHGLIPFDVSNSVPGNWKGWQGMSGAALRDRDVDRLRGVVVKVDTDRELRRLYVRSLPNPEDHEQWAAALAASGTGGVLEAADAPTFRRLVTMLDPAGRPYRAGDVVDLHALGVRHARTDIDLRGDPYYPYVGRPFDEKVTAALDRRVDGSDRRALLLVGDAMTGKSRTAARALQVHPVLSGWRLLAPRRTADLSKVAGLTRDMPAVLWLDNINNFAVALDDVLTSATATPFMLSSSALEPRLVVIGTVRRDVLAALQEQPLLRSLVDVVTDTRRVELLEVPADWSEAEQESLHGADAAIRQQVSEGVPLGEALAAANELRIRMSIADDEQSAVVSAVIDWRRTGTLGPLPVGLLGDLWANYLPRRHSRMLQGFTSQQRARRLAAALAWTTADLPGLPVGLVMHREDGLSVDDYLLSGAFAGDLVPLAVWQAVRSRLSPDRTEDRVALLDVAYNAQLLSDSEVAQDIWHSILKSPVEDDATARAAWNLGILHAQRNAHEQAIVAFRRAASVTTSDLQVPASLRLARHLGRLGDTKQSCLVYDSLVDGGPAADGPRPARLLAELPLNDEDIEGIRDAYQRLAEAGTGRTAAKAAFELGLFLMTYGQSDGIRDAMLQAIDSQDRDIAPFAAWELGTFLHEEEPEHAKAAYRVAVDSHHIKWGPAGAQGLANLLMNEGNIPQARSILEPFLQDKSNGSLTLMAAGGRLRRLEMALAEMRPYLENVLGTASQTSRSAHTHLVSILERERHHDRCALLRSVIVGHSPGAAWAANYLGATLWLAGDTQESRQAFLTAMDSGHAGQASTAALDLALLLEKEAKTEADLQLAIVAYERALSGKRLFLRRKEIKRRLAALHLRLTEATGTRGVDPDS